MTGSLTRRQPYPSASVRESHAWDLGKFEQASESSGIDYWTWRTNYTRRFFMSEARL